MSAIADYIFGGDTDAPHVDPQAGLTLAEVNAQTTFIEAYGVKVGMEEFDKVFNEPKAWTNDERLLVAKAANAILAERVGPEGLNLRPAPQALGAIYDSLRGPSWKMNEPGWKPSERTSGVSAWHGVEVSGAPENANGLMSVLGDAFLGEGTFTIQDQPIVALRLPNNQLTGSASTGLLQPLAKLQASGDTSAALATINVAGNALTGPLSGEPLAQLPHLAELYAGFNSLSGSVPYAALGAG